MTKHDLNLTTVMVGLTIYLVLDGIFDIGGDEFIFYVVLIFIITTLVIAIYKGTKEGVKDVTQNTENIYVITEIDRDKERLVAYRHTKEEAEQAIEELKRPNREYRYRQLDHAIKDTEYK